MRIIATLGLVLATCWSTTMAQHLNTLQNNAPLEQYTRESTQVLPGLPPAEGTAFSTKTDCDQPVNGALPAMTGKTLEIEVPTPVDTVGLGSLTLQCLNCASAEFGQASVSGNTLVYDPLPGVNLGLDTLLATYCSASQGTCTDTLSFVVLARRANRNYFPALVDLSPEQVFTTTADASVLPGALRCNFFEDCPDNYDGRDQLAYFTDYTAPVSEWVYRASRFRGIDTVCVTLCDEFGICDTYRYAFRVSRPSRQLPFMDDFSYAGPVTDEDLWLDREVYVNSSLAINPPSVGVATFDGVNERGRPWGGLQGQADRLTSNYLNLGGVSDMPVLTFWLQRGGRGDRPEVRDSLLLQFRLSNGNWTTVRTYAGLPSSQPVTAVDTFRFFSVPITSLFYHPNFQFRFINLADRQGLLDTWHLDYVRLDVQQTQRTFSDVAFTELPAPIIQPYTSMPWRHLQAAANDYLRPNLEVGVYNHADQTLNASPSQVSLRELNSNVQPFGPVTLFNAQDINIPNGANILRTYSLLNDPVFPVVWPDYFQVMTGPAFNGWEALAFRMTYSLNNTSQISSPGFEAVPRNDQVTATTVFDNYFAYDDGTAEVALENGPGRQVAQRYTSSVPDTLRGVQLLFPRTSADYSQQDMRLRVWVGELDNTPEYQLLLNPDYATNYFDTLQGFTSYPLVDENGELVALPLPAGDFYVGWQQITNCQLGNCISVGYDRNNPEVRERIFVNNGQGWGPISGVVDGALMIRPVVGSEAPLPTATTQPEGTDWQVRVFPNPTSDLLHIEWPATDEVREVECRLFNAFGQLVRQQRAATEMTVRGLPAGIYWLQVSDRQGRRNHQQKIVVID